MDKTSRLEKSKAYQNDKYVRSWLVGLKERTQANYLEEFSEWYAFMGMTPTQMIEKRLRDTRSDNMAERMFFEQKFREYKQHLEDLGTLSPIAVKTQLIPVASFFSRNGLPLNLKRGDWESNQVQKVKTSKLKIAKEEIKAMYTHGNTRDRALLLVLAQSGFSEVDVSSFRIEDLKGLYTAPETEHFFLEKPREKTGEMQATCFSYEAVHDLKAWLLERGNPREGYLFISTTKRKGNQLEVRAIGDAMKALAIKAFGKEKSKKFKTKALRSFYNSALLRANIQPQELKDLMFGHQRRGARGHYDYDEQTIRENYAKAFEHMSINGLQTRTDIVKLKEDMIKQKADFYDQLNAQKAEFEKKINSIHDFVERNLNKNLYIVNKLCEDEDGRRRVQQAVADLQDEQYEKDRVAEEREGRPPEAVKAAEESEKRLRKQVK
jgi:hypothetical protein